MKYTIKIFCEGDGYVVNTSSNEILQSQYLVDKGTVVMFSAVPNQHNIFYNWNINITSNYHIFDNRICIDVQQDNIILTAVFKSDDYLKKRVKINIIGNGFVEEKNYGLNLSTGIYDFIKNDCLIFIGIPEDPFMFFSWFGCDFTDKNIGFIYNLDTDREITCTFKEKKEVTIQIYGSGKVKDLQNDIEVENNSITYSLTQDSFCFLYSEPKNEFKFEKYSVNGQDNLNNPYSFIIKNNTLIQVYFIIKKFILFINIIGNGYYIINKDGIKIYESKSFEYEYNKDIFIEFISDEDCYFDYLKINDQIYNNNIYSTKIKQDIVIECEFIAKKKLTIKQKSDFKGIVQDLIHNIKCTTSTCVYYLKRGTNIKLIAMPLHGTIFFDKWENCSSCEGNICSLMLNDDIEIAVYFIKKYKVYIQSIGLGQIKINNQYICNSNEKIFLFFKENESVKFEAIPDKHNKFIKWNTGATTTSITLNIINDIEIIGTFKKLIDLEFLFEGDGWGKVIDSNNIINCEQKFLKCENNVYIYDVTSSKYTFEEDQILNLQFIPNSNIETIEWYNCDNSLGFNAIKFLKYTGSYYEFIKIKLTLKSYFIAVQLSGNGSGTVISDNDLYIINCGLTCNVVLPYYFDIKLTAIPDTGSNFIKWDDDQSTNSVKNISKISRNYIVSPRFELQKRTIKITIVGSGTVREISNLFNDIKQTTTFTFDYGTELEIQAIPDYGWSFVSYTNCSNNSFDRCLIKLIDNIEIKVQFTINKYSLTVYCIFENQDLLLDDDIFITSSPSGIKSPKIKTAEFNFNTLIKLTPINNDIYVFDKWITTVGVVTDNICKFNIVTNTQLSAKYVYKKFKLSIQIIGYGSVTFDTNECLEGTCIYYLPYNTEVTLCCVPDSGYEFTSIKIGSKTYTESIQTFNILSDINVIVTFSIMKYTLTVTAESNNGETSSFTVTSSPTGISCSKSHPTSSFEYNQNTSIILTASPSDKLIRWSNGVETTTCKLKMVSDIQIIAYFK